MANLAKDIQIDIDSADLIISDTSNKRQTIFEVVWGNVLDGDAQDDLYANIIVTPENQSTLIYDEENNTGSCYVHFPYYPSTSLFKIRFVTLNDGEYQPYSNNFYNKEFDSFSYVKNWLSENVVSASEIRLININGLTLVLFQSDENGDKAYIYSNEKTDLLVIESDDQSAQLLAICAPTKYYRYPTTGIGITNYLNSVVKHSDIGDRVISEFENDGTPIQTANFDPSTGKIATTFIPRNIEEDNSVLTDMDDLDVKLLKRATDQNIRKAVESESWDDSSDEWDDEEDLTDEFMTQAELIEMFNDVVKT